MLDCTILNGLTRFGFDESLTFVSSSGSSMIDYFIASCDLCLEGRINSLRVLSSVDSSHLPVCIKFNVNLQEDTHQKIEKRWIQKRVWDTFLEHQFIEAFNSSNAEDMCKMALSQIDSDVNIALQFFCDALIKSSSCMEKRVYVGSQPRRADWYDKECQELKRKTSQALINYIS